ncbi:ELMO domain-containing protein A [Morella rubra]|uniref:ELMO domain-containing protein A n=1 Tax=Morella rubra TaxID=262757 RepID=A0A6A1WCS7_9ROSI|nr:ELMO domain-containing protein A [Morella rubra]
MTSRTLRRRLHHGDVDGKRQEHFEALGSDGLNEPLLDYHVRDDRQSEHEDLWDDERRKEHQHWTLLFSQLIAQWAEWLVDYDFFFISLANIVLGPGSLIGRLLPLSSNNQRGQVNKLLPPTLSPLQLLFSIVVDSDDISTNDPPASHPWKLIESESAMFFAFDTDLLFTPVPSLQSIFHFYIPDTFNKRVLPSLKSDLWKEMGWQGPDPSTDFRGGGFISLENLIFFAQKYQESFQRLLHKQDGIRAEWEYPFAVAGINISFMLAQMLDLQSGKPTYLAGIRFLELLEEDEMAFDNLYCVAFQMMDAQWLAKRASYMEFNDVLKSTRTQLERELALEDVSSVRDLPAFNLLKT